MVWKFNINVEQTEGFKRALRLAFSFTPIEPSGPSHPYDPIASDVVHFRAGTRYGTSWTLAANTNATFGTYVVQDRKVQCIHEAEDLSPGQMVTLSSPTWWKGPDKSKAGAFTAINKSGSTQSVMMAWRSGWNVMYHPIANGSSIVAPSAWKLQVYVVSDAINPYTVLRPEDLLHPIFPAPLRCEAIPDVSTWIMSQDPSGITQLRSYGNLEKTAAINMPAQKAKKTIEERSQLSQVLERLALMENSITRIQEDVALGQRSVAEMRNHIYGSGKSVKRTKEEIPGPQPVTARLSDVERSVAAVEAEAAGLAEAFGRGQDQLLLVQQAVADTQRLLAGTEKSTHDRLSTLEQSAGHNRSNIVAVEKSLHQTQDQISIVQQLVLAKQPAESESIFPSRLSTDLDKQTPTAEARMERLEKLTQEHHSILREIDGRLSGMEARTNKFGKDLGAAQVLLTRQVNATEVGLGDDRGVSGGDSPSSSVKGSPVMFPNHLSDGPSTF